MMLNQIKRKIMTEATIGHDGSDTDDLMEKHVVDYIPSSSQGNDFSVGQHIKVLIDAVFDCFNEVTSAWWDDVANSLG